ATAHSYTDRNSGPLDPTQTDQVADEPLRSSRSRAPTEPRLRRVHRRSRSAGGSAQGTLGKASRAFGEDATARGWVGGAGMNEDAELVVRLRKMKARAGELIREHRQLGVQARSLRTQEQLARKARMKWKTLIADDAERRERQARM